MQITDVKAVYPNYQHVVPSWRTNFWQIVVRVETDLGVTKLVMGGRNAPRDRLWLGEPRPVDGYLLLPEGPGFGVTLNESLL